MARELSKEQSSCTALPELVFTGISKSFDQRVILSDLSLSVNKGASLVIIGPSGAGKTVLLKCALGLIEPDAGSVTMAGKKIKRLSCYGAETLFRSIGVVFQSSALFDSLTVFDNILFATPFSGNSAKNRVADLLAAVGLPQHTASLYPSELSGGMQRRVALARALALNPKILFFDEPTAGLDPISSSIISSLIRKCIDEIKATVVTITHDLSAASVIGDEVALLDKGSIAWHGQTQELWKTKDTRIRQMIDGNPKGPLTTLV